MTTQHTPGRLKFRLFDEDFCELNNATGNQIGEAYSEANARRLVAAWNACLEIPTAVLENLADDGATIAPIYRDLLVQRDELLTALKLIRGAESTDCALEYTKGIARAAIAKAQGEA